MHSIVTIVSTDPQLAELASAQWAIGQVTEMLESKGVGVRRGIGAAQDGKAVHCCLGASKTVSEAAAGAGIALPQKPESFALFDTDQGLHVWGYDERGLVYGLTELADRIMHAQSGQLFGALPHSESPMTPIRSIARLFCSEIEDKVWFYDKQGWREYLTMLASNRFNRFSLTLGMGYNYPYHNGWISDVYFYFPYPFLLDLPGFDIRVKELPGDERDLNLEMLKFIGKEAKRRGLDFQLALWTQRYDFNDVPNAEHTVVGVTDDNLAPYCRKAVTTLLAECPEITGVTFRVHVEGGIAEGEYDFWKEVFAGVADCGRAVEIDMHAKGLDDTTIKIASESGMPVTVSPKYLAEHMGPAYHQSAIREREYPPEKPRSEREKLSEGSRKFLRYSYGDLLKKDRDYKVLYRIWAGTQRFLIWGDPEMAAGYARSSTMCGSNGVEWCEPLSFKGRMGSSMAGQRSGYNVHGMATKRDWRRYEYQYRVWGRLLYFPEAPRESWLRYLRSHCGNAAEPIEQALASASRVLPLVTLTHGPSASNNHYWPEIYTNFALIDGAGRRAYQFDMDGPARFGNAPTFDSMLFATAREYVTALHEGQSCDRYTPLDVANWLDALAAQCMAGCTKALSLEGSKMREAQRMLGDIEILGGMARYFASKYRAACWAELYILTGVTTLIDATASDLRKAVAGWEHAAAVSKRHFPDDITFGPQPWLRGSWHTRAMEIRAELSELEALRGATHNTVHPDETTRQTIAKIKAHRERQAGNLIKQPPQTFERGQAVTVHAEAEPGSRLVLHYRHVNQAERWQNVQMMGDGGAYVAEVPASYTDSEYHLQFFVSARVKEDIVVLSPGLERSLTNDPYHLALQL